MTNSANSREIVSVIVPTFNQAEFLREALQSVIKQDFVEWRAYVIDNHSTDHTRQVITDLQDSRITYVSIQNNGVIAASRNLGLAHSRGNYVAFLDSDDYWYPTKLTTCLRRLNDGHDLVCHAEHWLQDGRLTTKKYGPDRRALYRPLLMRGNCLSTSAVVGLREMFSLLGGFSQEERFVTAEDYDLWLRVSHRGHRISFIDDVLGVYRIHESSASSAVERNHLAESAVVAHHLSSLSSINSVRRRRRLARSHYLVGRTYQRLGSLHEGRKHLLRALCLWPFSPSTLIGLVLQSAALLVGGERRTS